MTRVQDQPEDHSQLARRVLSWISKARRALQIEELHHAVSVEVSDEDIENESLVSTDLMVSVCAGLVTADNESNAFRLVHFTVQEFFEKGGSEWLPTANNLTAETCLTYLFLCGSSLGKSCLSCY